MLQPPQFTCAIWLATQPREEALARAVKQLGVKQQVRTLHRQVDGAAYGALHTGGAADVHEQRPTAAALELRHLRAWTAARATLSAREAAQPLRSVTHRRVGRA